MSASSAPIFVGSSFSRANFMTASVKTGMHFSYAEVTFLLYTRNASIFMSIFSSTSFLSMPSNAVAKPLIFGTSFSLLMESRPCSIFSSATCLPDFVSVFSASTYLSRMGCASLTNCSRNVSYACTCLSTRACTCLLTRSRNFALSPVA